MKTIHWIALFVILCVVLFVAGSDLLSDPPSSLPQASTSYAVDLPAPSSSGVALASSNAPDSSASSSAPELMSEAEPKFIPPAIELTPQIEFTIDHHIGTLIVCNAVLQPWETTAQMDPDSIVSFYMSLSRDDERLPRCTVYTPTHPKFGNILMYSKYIEQVGALYFGVSSEMMRESSYYSEPEDCYELWGLGSVVSHTINKVDIIDNQTIVSFDMFRNGNPEHSGALTIQNNTDGSWQYKSFELLEFGTTVPCEQKHL